MRKTALMVGLLVAGVASAQVSYPEFNGPHELVQVTLAGYEPVRFTHVASFDTPYACTFAALQLNDAYRLNRGEFVNAANRVMLVCVPQNVPAACAASPGLCFDNRMPVMAVQP